MGTGNDAPWDNDRAADWFGDVFDESQLARRVRAALAHHLEIRAAASLLLFLGRAYVWLIADLDGDLNWLHPSWTKWCRCVGHDVLPVDAVRLEAASLRSRMDRPNTFDDATLSAAWNALRVRR